MWWGGLLALLLLWTASCHAADEDFAQQALQLINQQRAKAGVQAVTLNKDLMRFSSEWAQQLAKRNKMKHRDEDSLNDFRDQLNCAYLNENLFMSSMRPSAEMVVDGWMHSRGHRNNLLKDEIDQMGIGIARAANGAYYVVFNGANSHPPKIEEEPAIEFPHAEESGSGSGIRFNGIPIGQ